MFLEMRHRDHQQLQPIINELNSQSYEKREHVVRNIAHLFVGFLGEHAEGHEHETKQDQRAMQEVREDTPD